MGYFQQALAADVREQFDATAKQLLDCSKECCKRKLMSRRLNDTACGTLLQEEKAQLLEQSGNMEQTMQIQGGLGEPNDCVAAGESLKDELDAVRGEKAELAEQLMQMETKLQHKLQSDLELEEAVGQVCSSHICLIAAC